MTPVGRRAAGARRAAGDGVRAGVALACLAVSVGAFASGSPPGCAPGSNALAEGLTGLSAEQAIALAARIARVCYRGEGLGGRPLDFSAVRARHLPGSGAEPDRWMVSIDELQPVQEPSGRHFIIDRATGRWTLRVVE